MAARLQKPSLLRSRRGACVHWGIWSARGPYIASIVTYLLVLWKQPGAVYMLLSHIVRRPSILQPIGAEVIVVSFDGIKASMFHAYAS